MNQKIYELSYAFYHAGYITLPVIPNPLELQERVLGHAPEYIHSKRHGPLYRPAYRDASGKIDKKKTLIAFVEDEEQQPIPVASVLHHIDTRNLNQKLVDLTRFIAGSYGIYFDPWMVSPVHARFIPGRYWRSRKRSAFEVRLHDDGGGGGSDDDEEITNEMLVVMIVNLGRLPRTYRVLNLEAGTSATKSPTSETVQVDPGHVLVCRQGTLVTPIESLDPLRLELTAHWVVSNKESFVDALYDAKDYSGLAVPAHPLPFIDLRDTSTKELRTWSKANFSPFMYGTLYGKDGIVSRMPSIPEIYDLTFFSKEDFWLRYYPPYTEEESYYVHHKHTLTMAEDDGNEDAMILDPIGREDGEDQEINVLV
jgi:hypothetical protein